MAAFAQRLSELGIPLHLLNELLPRGGVAVEQFRETFLLGFVQFATQVAIDQFFPVIFSSFIVPPSGWFLRTNVLVS